MEIDVLTAQSTGIKRQFIDIANEGTRFLCRNSAAVSQCSALQQLLGAAASLPLRHNFGERKQEP